MKAVRILIADDHEVVREGARAMIEQQRGWKVCGMAQNGEEAVRAAKMLKPDVVVLDGGMPELNGLEVLRQIKPVLPQTEVLFFSAHHSPELVEKVFEAGAKSYIGKTEAGQHLVEAIKSLAEHQPFFTPQVSKILLRQLLPEEGDKRSYGAARLTEREDKVARLLADGKSNKEAAASLEVSVRTVEACRAAVMRKVGVNSLAGLVRYAVRNFMIDA